MTLWVTKIKFLSLMQILPNDVKVGSKILIDDGLIEMEVISVKNSKILCKVKNGGVVSNKKGVNVPNVALSMPLYEPKRY